MIKQQIDEEYHSKLKELKQEALRKIQAFEEEHKNNLQNSYISYKEENRRRPNSRSGADNNINMLSVQLKGAKPL